MQSSISAVLGMSLVASTSVPSPAMNVCAAAYVAVVLLLALRQFSRHGIKIQPLVSQFC